MKLNNIFTKKKNTNELNNWHKDSYQSAITQRNILLLLTFISVIAIILLVITIRYVKNTKAIQPFVIEIEKKSGIPTVVEPISTKEYTANEAVRRYFIMKYIKAREEYFSSTYNMNYSMVVRVMSSPQIYANDYRPKFSTYNPTSPYNLYGTNSQRTVSWKSIIFPNQHSAQIRLTMEVKGTTSIKMDKIIFMEFEFSNIVMNEDERLINPLGFVVTLYRIEDENKA